MCGFSNCGMRTTTGTLTAVYWYAALILKTGIKKVKLKNNPDILANTNHFWHHYMTHAR